MRPSPAPASASRGDLGGRWASVRPVPPACGASPSRHSIWAIRRLARGPGCRATVTADVCTARRACSCAAEHLRGAVPRTMRTAPHPVGYGNRARHATCGCCAGSRGRRRPGPLLTGAKGRSPGSARSGRAQGGLPDGVDGAGDIGRPEQTPPILRTVAPMHGVLCRPTLACGLVPGGPIFLRSPVVAKLRSARACGCAGRHTQRGGPAVAPRMSEIRRRPLSPRLPEVVCLGAFSTRARGPGPGPGRRARPPGPVCSPRPRGWPENLRMTSGHA